MAPKLKYEIPVKTAQERSSNHTTFSSQYSAFVHNAERMLSESGWKA
jgi:hypothetical protein